MSKQTAKDPSMAAVLAWIVPGGGHFYLGQRSKAVLLFVLLVTTFFIGWALSGFCNVYLSSTRVRDVVGLSTVIGQMLNGGPALLAIVISRMRGVLQDPADVNSIYQIGNYYTLIAGMLNLVLVLDAVYRANRTAKS